MPHTCVAKLNLRHSAYTAANREDPGSNGVERPLNDVSSVKPSHPRQLGIGDYLNNYTMSVREMRAKDPLPVLIPIRPYRYRHPEEREEVIAPAGRWRERLGENLTDKVKVKTRFPYPGRDWFRHWVEYMYVIGEFGAKQQK